MKHNVRISAALMTLVLLSAAISSCGSTDNADAVNTSAVTAPTETEAVTAPVTDWKSTGIEAKDWDGRSFTVLNEDNPNMNNAWFSVAPEATDGEALNDALYLRNQTIEEVFNVDIIEVRSAAIQADLRKAVSAGDTAYDASLDNIVRHFALAQEGMLVDWYTLPYINLKASWWDQSVIDQLTYKDKLFFCIGDISPVTNVRVYSLVFNKDLCRELGIDMPYQYVLDGKWTIDVFNQYITDVNKDVNGDGVMNYDDRWGYFSQDGNSFMMYFAGGGRVVAIDDNSEMDFVMVDDRNINLAIKSLEISIDKTKTLMADQYVKDHNNQWSAASAWFASGGALMRSSVFEPVPRDYRAMETDFGVLPYPKLDDAQETYYTPAEEYSRMFAVPKTADTEFVGMILEVLAAQSVSTVSPAFYDVCLEGKSVRDNESAEILDIIFANKVFDYGLVADVAGFKNMMKSMEAKGSTDVASTFETAVKKAEKAIEKIAKNFDNLD
ncbi:MAG: extracellular solute-binding protein [Clostridia bacterium]|nr:extracellular solute-binding protein [Clostridia bacterium]